MKHGALLTGARQNTEERRKGPGHDGRRVRLCGVIPAPRRKENELGRLRAFGVPPIPSTAQEGHFTPGPRKITSMEGNGAEFLESPNFSRPGKKRISDR